MGNSVTPKYNCFGWCDWSLLLKRWEAQISCVCDMKGSTLKSSSYLASVLFVPGRMCDSQVAVRTLSIELEARGPGFRQMCSAYTSHLESMVCRSLWNKVWNQASADTKAGGSLLFWNSQMLILWLASSENILTDLSWCHIDTSCILARRTRWCHRLCSPGRQPWFYFLSSLSQPPSSLKSILCLTVAVIPFAFHYVLCIVSFRIKNLDDKQLMLSFSWAVRLSCLHLFLRIVLWKICTYDTFFSLMIPLVFIFVLFTEDEQQALLLVCI